jgi:hypothetical protein
MMRRTIDSEAPTISQTTRISSFSTGAFTESTGAALEGGHLATLVDRTPELDSLGQSPVRSVSLESLLELLLIEMRVQNYVLSQGLSFNEDLDRLRAELSKTHNS